MADSYRSGLPPVAYRRDTEAMRGEPNDANASVLVSSGCCAHAASPQAPPEGTHYVRIPLESFEIEGLIRLKVRRTGSAASAYARQKALAASPTAPARVQPMSWRSNSLSCLSSRRLRARARHSDNRELPLVTIWLA